MTDMLSRPLAPEGITPPQALDAERSVLAALLLDHEATGRAIEMLEPQAFYRTAHQKIYEAILAIYNRNDKSDLVTLGEELRKRGELEAVGGLPALAQIVEMATTSVNLEQHARLVNSKAILRQLIRASQEISQEAYAGSDETPSILDRAEQRIFSITDQRVRQGFAPIQELMMHSIKHIEDLAERNKGRAEHELLLTGVSSGYADLDKLTAGFQRGDLVIIAGRPSMGKTSFALNIAENAATGKDKVPVAVFSLEMSKEQLVLRLLCSQAEVPLHKVRNGYLSDNELRKLMHLIGPLYSAPIMIDDSAAPTLMEIRAKCRRLRSERKLGLVIIDYLQLIRAAGNVENRVQEISQISRGLKALAKELDVPVIALSQLSRAVEQRGGSGRPQLSDLRESGCLTADTRVCRADTGAMVAMGDLLASGERDIPVWTLDKDLRLVRGTMTHVFASGVKPVFELRLASGRTIKASANHPFLTLDGWRRLDRLATGERLAVPRALPAPTRVTHWECAEPSRERLGRVATLLADEELSRLATPDLLWDAIVSVTPFGEVPVFDATVPGTSNFVADGIVVHNSIEQDSDVVMFVYREVVYKKDTAEPGKAQIIVAKQRNGPTDDVDLTFLRECTKFVPYSPVMPDETVPGF